MPFVGPWVCHTATNTGPLKTNACKRNTDILSWLSELEQLIEPLMLNQIQLVGTYTTSHIEAELTRDNHPIGMLRAESS